MASSTTTVRANRWLFLPALILMLLSGCGGGGDGAAAVQADDAAYSPPRDTHENLHAVLWMQNSAEYRAAALQAFGAARLALDRALADPTWTALPDQRGDYENLPPAILLDIDDTILDNTAFEVSLIRSGGFYSKESWDDWVYQSRALSVPGALEFCKYAADKKVALFYVTNRREPHVGSTRRLMEELGFPMMVGRVSIIPRTDSRDKRLRREAIAQNHRVILQIGDSLHDFLSDTELTSEERKAMVAQYPDFWGEKWFVLPNPIYGEWETALYDYDFDLSDEEELARKNALLRD